MRTGLRWVYKLLIVAIILNGVTVGLIVASAGPPTSGVDDRPKPSASDADTKYEPSVQGMSIEEANSIYYRCIERADQVAGILDACEVGWINNVGFDVWNKDPSMAPWE